MEQQQENKDDEHYRKKSKKKKQVKSQQSAENEAKSLQLGPQNPWNRTSELIKHLKSDPNEIVQSRTKEMGKSDEESEEQHSSEKRQKQKKKKGKKSVAPLPPPQPTKKSKIPLELKDFLSSGPPVVPNLSKSNPFRTEGTPLVPFGKEKKQYVENPNPGASERFIVRRGKERETPKPKKPTPLKRIILEERKEKHLLLSSQSSQQPLSTLSSSSPEFIPSTYSVDFSSASPSFVSSELSPSTDSPEESIDSPEEEKGSSPSPVKYPKLPNTHNPREYCLQDMPPELNETVKELLGELRRFQLRLAAKDPIKAQSRKRFVAGLREVGRGVDRQKAKAVIVASNLEESEELDNITSHLLHQCKKQRIPVVFALTRRELGRALGKTIRISVVGILDYDGANEQFKRMIALQRSAQQSFSERHPELFPSKKKKTQNKERKEETIQKEEPKET